MNGTLSKPSLQKSFNGPILQSDVQDDWTPEIIHNNLKEFSCGGCELGLQRKLTAPVVYRGNPECGKMMIGEAPGLVEDERGIPFIGPAGELLDKIFAAADWNTNQDWYLTNIVKCRPFAEPGSRRQNNTPLTKHIRACNAFLKQEIKYIKPHTIVLLGKTAITSLLPNLKHKRMEDIVGKVYISPSLTDIILFTMYRPAALKHAERFPQKRKELRKQTWQHVTILRELVDEQESLYG